MSFIESFQTKYLYELGTRFVFPSDEFYALANRTTPVYEAYEGFPQLENGVGLMRLFQYEIEEELSKVENIYRRNKKIIIATGILAYDYIVDIFKKIQKKIPGLEIEVVPIVNNFFGDKITVSGLVTGIDLISQLKGKESDAIIIPISMMKCDEEIFLDNISLDEASKELATNVIVSKVSGKDIISKLLGVN